MPLVGRLALACAPALLGVASLGCGLGGKAPEDREWSLVPSTEGAFLTQLWPTRDNGLVWLDGDDPLRPNPAPNATVVLWDQTGPMVQAGEAWEVNFSRDGEPYFLEHLGNWTRAISVLKEGVLVPYGPEVHENYSLLRLDATGGIVATNCPPTGSPYGWCSADEGPLPNFQAQFLPAELAACESPDASPCRPEVGFAAWQTIAGEPADSLAANVFAVNQLRSAYTSDGALHVVVNAQKGNERRVARIEPGGGPLSIVPCGDTSGMPCDLWPRIIPSLLPRDDVEVVFETSLATTTYWRIEGGKATQFATNPPGEGAVAGVARGGDGRLYLVAHESGVDETRRLYVLEGSEWRLVANLRGIGNWVDTGGVAVTVDGTVYAVFQDARGLWKLD
jgi:hypothetical protein